MQKLETLKKLILKVIEENNKLKEESKKQREEIEILKNELESRKYIGDERSIFNY